MSSVIKKGDFGAVDEVLGWDPRGDDEEYDMMEKAQEAFSRIKKELSSQKKSLKEEKQKHEELFQTTARYIKRFHAAEEENKRLKEAAKIYIADVAEYGESFCNAVGHDPHTCSECVLKGLIQ